MILNAMEKDGALPGDGAKELQDHLKTQTTDMMKSKPALDAPLNHQIQTTAPKITTVMEIEPALSGVGAKEPPDDWIRIYRSISKFYPSFFNK